LSTYFGYFTGETNSTGSNPGDINYTPSKEIEDEANSYFQRIYNHPPHPTLSIDEIIDLLKKSKEESNNQNKSSILKTRQFNIGDRVQSRDYRTKEIKWQYGVILNRFGKLHYLVKLDNGYELKRHIDQLRSTSVRKVKFDEEELILPPIKRRPQPERQPEQRRPEPVNEPVRESEPVVDALRKSVRIRKPVNRMNL